MNAIAPTTESRRRPHSPARAVAAGTFPQPPVDTATDDFIEIFREYPAGVGIVTADPGDGPVALVASSVVSVSARPPLLVFSVSDQASAAPALARAETVVVHFFSAARLPLVKLVARSGEDRFGDRGLWARLPSGEPLYAGSRSWLRGEITNRVPAGTATLYLVHVLETGRLDGDQPHRPLVYHDRAWHELGAHSRLTD